MNEIDGAAEVASGLETTRLGRKLFVLDEVTSTNDTAKQLARDGCPDGTVVLSDYQTGGKGRRGRTWNSQKGAGIAMSLVLRPDITASIALRYTLAAALGVSAAMCDFSVDTRIKWPNDLMSGDKKLCGILTECGCSGNKVDFLVVGIGLNVNQSEFTGDLGFIATSMRIVAGTVFDRNEVTTKLINRLEPYFECCSNEDAFKTLLAEYKKRSCTYGKPVKITGTDVCYEGTAVDFDSLGRIVLLRKDGSNVIVNAGDVTLRGSQS